MNQCEATCLVAGRRSRLVEMDGCPSDSDKVRQWDVQSKHCRDLDGEGQER